jgi:hypothetical protein
VTDDRPTAMRKAWKVVARVSIDASAFVEKVSGSHPGYR